MTTISFLDLPSLRPAHPAARPWPMPALAVQDAVHALIVAAGHPVSDFVVALDEASQLSRALGLDDRLLIVRKMSSGVERLYTVGDHHCWMGLLAGDLHAGLFDAPAH